MCNFLLNTYKTDTGIIVYVTTIANKYEAINTTSIKARNTNLFNDTINIFSWQWKREFVTSRDSHQPSPRPCQHLAYLTFRKNNCYGEMTCFRIKIHQTKIGLLSAYLEPCITINLTGWHVLWFERVRLISDPMISWTLITFEN